MFKIEKNVPVPAFSSGPNRFKFPFRDMEIGDSFAVPHEEYNSLRSAASHHGKRLGRKFTIRQQSDGSFRCWRID